jgi:subtilisin family serine protease
VLRLAVATLVLAATPVWAGSLAPNLEERLLSAGPDDFVPVVVMMEAFPAQDELLAVVRGLNRENRRVHVVSTLQGLAERTQSPVRTVLAAEPDGTRDVRVLWGINGLALEAKPQVIERLAEIPGVRWVLHDHGTPHPGTTEIGSSLQRDSAGSGRRSGQHAEGSGPTGGDTSGPNPDAAVAGEVTAMGAEQVWNELGYTGAGIIVAVVDTGIDRTHPDLADHIWTNLDEIPYNGLDDDDNGLIDDTWGWDFCTGSNDPSGGAHGTQVAGQVAGDGTDGIVTGMAPDVELMALGIDCDTPSRAWEASDYAIAKGAHIITQSYSWWWTDLPDYEGFRRQTDAELAAGVIHANSAGNHGGDLTTYPIPYNISAPANCPAPWVHPDQTLVGGVSSILGVGDIVYGSDVIASHSSLGPAAWEDIRANTDPEYPYPMAPEYQDYPYENGTQMGLIKPDLSAYGLGTTTTCPGSSYCSFSGTSSATPHVSGTLALMLQANSGATPAELAEVIMTTAEHRGDPGKNNVYGAGLVQAFATVSSVESGVLYASHSIDDGYAGNGDLMLDPGERVTLQIMVESRTDSAIEGLEGILSTAAPGITIHNQYATFPDLPARGAVGSNAPHFSLTVGPDACSRFVAFDLEFRYDGEIRKSTFHVRIGEPETVTLLHDDFESNLGWATDPGTSTQGFWVREDPIGVLDGLNRLSNPEDDTTETGVTCWVTGNGELGGRKDENNNDVDGGQVTLLSPPFGLNYMLSLELSYDRWFYDVESGNRFTAEVSGDGGLNWTTVEELIYGAGGWSRTNVDLFALFPPTDDMRLRFVVDDDYTDDPVEGAVDEVLVEGVRVNFQDYTPAAALAPNPVGDMLRVGTDPAGHTVLNWEAPLVDVGHDAATLYRIERANSPEGTFSEAGTATVARWVDVDALGAPETFHYRVRAENSGGGE